MATTSRGYPLMADNEGDKPQAVNDAIQAINDDVEEFGSPSWDDITSKPSTFPPSSHTHAISDVTGLQTDLDSKLDVSNNLSDVDSASAARANLGLGSLATMDSVDLDLDTKADLVGGVIPTSQLPKVAIGESFSVSSQAAMLALTAQIGDVAIRTDLGGEKYLLLGTDPSQLGNWVSMATSGGDVSSVNGQTGVVVLGYGDVGAAPASTATTLSNHTSNTNNPHNVTKSQVGLGNVDNTSDEDKPVSDATQAALETKANIVPRVSTITSSSAPAPNGATTDLFTVTALAANATFAAPSGTPANGQKLMIRIKDNGTVRTLSWNAIYRGSDDVALPTTTAAGKTMYVGFIYNSADAVWDCLAVNGGF